MPYWLGSVSGSRQHGVLRALPVAQRHAEALALLLRLLVHLLERHDLCGQPQKRGGRGASAGRLLTCTQCPQLPKWRLERSSARRRLAPRRLSKSVRKLSSADGGARPPLSTALRAARAPSTALACYYGHSTATWAGASHQNKRWGARGGHAARPRPICRLLQRVCARPRPRAHRALMRAHPHPLFTQVAVKTAINPL